MAIEIAVKCAVCGTKKKQSNHWFMMEVADGELRVRHFDLTTARALGFKPICGEGCLAKEISTSLKELLPFLRIHLRLEDTPQELLVHTS